LSLELARRPWNRQPLAFKKTERPLGFVLSPVDWCEYVHRALRGCRTLFNKQCSP
jgi:hypothetical protein